MGSSFSFTAELWEHEGPASWFFLSLPEALADDLEEMFGDRAAGFGSLKVEVTVGETRWSTSLFPDTKRATYLLPVKKAVRTAEQLVDGSMVVVDLVVLRNPFEVVDRPNLGPAALVMGECGGACCGMPDSATSSWIRLSTW